MRWILAATVVGLSVLAGPARAGGPLGLIGNDTGGIIPWSPFTEYYRLAIAADHCARYFKFPRITSVHRRYGDYIGFRCLFGPPPRAVVVTLY